MVLLSCQNPSFHFTTSCKVLRFTFSESRFILCPESPKTGRKGFSNHAMICSFIVMKCEGFSMITDLVDYLNNNLLIAHYCGFDISAPLPSYWTFDRFLKQLDNDVLSSIMKSQVLYLSNKVLLIHLLLVWTLLRLLQTLHRIIPNLFYPTNLSLITSPKQILIANLAYILLLTKQTRKV